ncbi:MAG: tyrosine-type recombinase/integrase [Elusimicrobiota bacterium]
MSFLIKRNKVYHLCWYQGKKICPACNGKKIIDNTKCERCRGTGEVSILHKKRLSADKQTALDYKAELDVKLRRSELGLQDTKKTWSSFVEEYLAYSKTNKAPGTYNLDKSALTNFTNIIRPTSLKDITPQQIERFKQERLKPVKQKQNKLNSPTTVNIDFRSIKSALSKAVQWSYLEKNPAKYVKDIKIPKEKPRFLSNMEIKKLLNSADELMSLIIKMLIHTGLRISELINLRWDDVDIKRKEIIVQAHDCFRPKSSHYRHIPIPDTFFPEFNNLRNKKGYVFTNGSSEKLKKRWLEDKFQQVRIKSGIEYCSLHDLRHTYASHLAEAGVDLKNGYKHYFFEIARRSHYKIYLQIHSN